MGLISDNEQVHSRFGGSYHFALSSDWYAWQSLLTTEQLCAGSGRSKTLDERIA